MDPRARPRGGAAAPLVVLGARRLEGQPKWPRPERGLVLVCSAAYDGRRRARVADAGFMLRHGLCLSFSSVMKHPRGDECRS